MDGNLINYMTKEVVRKYFDLIQWYDNPMDHGWRNICKICGYKINEYDSSVLEELRSHLASHLFEDDLSRIETVLDVKINKKRID